MQWCLSIISASKKQRLVNGCKIKSSLVYIGSFQPENWILEGKDEKPNPEERGGGGMRRQEEEEEGEKNMEELKIRKDRRINERFWSIKSHFMDSLIHLDAC